MDEVCAFCGKTISGVTSLIKSPINDNIYICDRCAEISVAVATGEINHKSARNLRKNWENAKNMELIKKKQKWNDTIFTLTPSEIHRELDRFIIGQDYAKKVLSVAIYNHNKRLNDQTGLIKKSNILLAEPTGCGKTLLTKTLAKILNVPFAIVDAASMTQAGYVGDDVEICIQRLVQMSDGNIEIAQKGIVYIDELDKIARTGKCRSHTRDVSGEGVQTALLKLIEGAEISVHINFERKNPQSKTILFDTTNVLFICGGAFERMIDTETKKAIGFNISSQYKDIDTNKTTNENLTPEELKNYGIIPELIGRLPVSCTLTVLTEDELIRVLTEPEDAITKEYQILFEKDDIKLIFEEDALKEIAKMALAEKTGARGLRSIIEEVMLEAMYTIPDNKDSISKCVITKESIKTKEPTIIKKGQSRKAVAF